MASRRGKRYVKDRTTVRGSKVVITRLPVVRCDACGRTMAHKPGSGEAAKVLTKHYARDHSG